MDRLGDDVRRELSRFGPALGMAAIVEAWPAAVGDAIAANAWPARLARDGTLYVAASSSAWAFELTQLARTMLDRLQEHLGEAAPRAIRFAVGSLPHHEDEAVTNRERTVPNVGAAERAEAARIAAPIADCKLREAVARAAAASLTRRLDDRFF